MESQTRGGMGETRVHVYAACRQAGTQGVSRNEQLSANDASKSHVRLAVDVSL